MQMIMFQLLTKGEITEGKQDWMDANLPVESSPIQQAG